MVTKGIITGVSKQDLLRAIKFCKDYFTQCFYRLMELKAFLDGGGLRDEDAGVLYDVLYTRAKFRFADVQCAMFDRLAWICHSKIMNKDVKLHAVSVEGPEMSLSQIKEILNTTAEEMNKTKTLSCWKNLKKKVPSSCRAKVNRQEECPSLAEEGAVRVAQKFEVSLYFYYPS